MNNDNIFAIHISPFAPETIWIGTATSGVLVSRDSGKTWAKDRRGSGQCAGKLDRLGPEAPGLHLRWDEPDILCLA